MGYFLDFRNEVAGQPKFEKIDKLDFDLNSNARICCE